MNPETPILTPSSDTLTSMLTGKKMKIKTMNLKTSIS